jgi:uncharacterized protein YuzE
MTVENPNEPDYFYVCGDPTVPDSCKVFKTIHVNERVTADVDEKGYVIGVESVQGLVDFDDLVELLKGVRVNEA